MYWEAIEQTHIGQTEQIKFEEDGPLLVESRQQMFFGGKVMWFVVLLIFPILKQAWLAGFKEVPNRP